MFAEIKGTTIEQYIILHKIERIKELLLYDELSLKEISYLLNYSSVAHLSGQFKKLTGLTPMHFKKMRSFKKRIALENV
jgi:AraC-like DNA-binding protein